jgi:hypothetical protein
MCFNYKGVWTGGHDVVGATAPAPVFYFAEGTCRPDFDPYITILNPGGTDADVKITYMKGDGTLAADTLIVPRTSRSTVSPRTKLGTGDDKAHDFNAKAECTNGQRIIAERPMYFNYHDVWTGGHCVIGATATGARWFFAEGYTGPNFQEWLCLQNPGTRDASVEITYFTLDYGVKGPYTVVVKAGTRKTVYVNEQAGSNLQLSAQLVSDQPVVVERPMYFNYNGVWTGGHDVVGHRY